MKSPFALALIAISCLSAGCAGQAFPTVAPETIVPTASATAITLPAATAVPVSGTATIIAPTPTSSPTAPPTSNPSSALSPTELKYRLIAQFGDPFFCDPDYYPVARAISEAEFERRFAEIQKITEVYQTILQHLGLAGQAVLSPDEKRLVYAEYKKLNSVILQPAGDKYQFSLRIPAGQPRGSAIEGLIDANANITITKQQPSFNTCPICLAVGTHIATPNGDMPVQDLKEGLPIWTADALGMRRPAFVLKTVSRDVSQTATLVDLELEDGRELFVSPGHPLPDGRPIGSLFIGDIVDGVAVRAIKSIPYQDHETYDILPSGDTGFYWANGILLKSTLAP